MDGGEIETPKASSGEEWEGLSPPQPTRGSGERRKLPLVPQRGPGQSPGRKMVLVHSELERTYCRDNEFSIFSRW